MKKENLKFLSQIEVEITEKEGYYIRQIKLINLI